MLANLVDKSSHCADGRNRIWMTKIGLRSMRSLWGFPFLTHKNLHGSLACKLTQLNLPGCWMRMRMSTCSKWRATACLEDDPPVVFVLMNSSNSAGHRVCDWSMCAGNKVQPYVYARRRDSDAADATRRSDTSPVDWRTLCKHVPNLRSRSSSSQITPALLLLLH